MKKSSLEESSLGIFDPGHLGRAIVRGAASARTRASTHSLPEWDRDPDRRVSG